MLWDMPYKNFCSLLILSLASCTYLAAQAKPLKGTGVSSDIPLVSFDVASIRPTRPDDPNFSLDPNPDAFTISGATLAYLVRYAFHLHRFQVSGVPAKIASLRYDIIAKMDTASIDASSGVLLKLGPVERQALLERRLQNLLVDRFGFEFNLTVKQAGGYAVMRKETHTGLHATGEPQSYTSGPGFLIAESCSMHDLSWLIAEQLDAPVIDQTGLVGNFGFSLKWSYETENNQTGELPLVDAVKDQLGLELHRKAVPVPMLEVKSVHIPSEN
jgi:uncharacterized protein (TIGR03435 family)